MKLFIYQHCPFCLRAQMIVGLKSLPVDIDIIMEGDAETPTRMVGRKVVPILQKEDGSYMPESMDIVHYLDSKQVPQVATGTVDAAIEAWCKQVSKSAFNLAVPRFTKGDFAELATPAAREAYRLREEKAFGDLEQLIADTPALLADVEPQLAALEPLVAERDTIDVTDFILFPVLRSLTIVKNIHFGDQVQAYLARVAGATGVSLLTEQAI